MEPFDELKDSPESQFEAVEKFKNRLQEDFINFGELLSEIKRKNR